jgi:hypothetical protein
VRELSQSFNVVVVFQKVPITIAPVDFLVDAANTPHEKLKNSHFHLGWHLFCKKREDKLPADGQSMAQFEQCLKHLRTMLGKMTRLRIEAAFEERFQLHFPDYTHGGDKKVKRVEDCVTAITLEMCDNEFLEMHARCVGCLQQLGCRC